MTKAKAVSTSRQSQNPVVLVGPSVAESYPSSAFFALSLTGVRNGPSNEGISREIERVEAEIRASGAPLSQVLSHNLEFFSRFDKSVPIEFQIESIKKGKGIPRENLLKDLLFLLEMKHGAMISCHDLSKCSGNFSFQVAAGDEAYEDISGRKREIRKGDILLKDKDRVSTSLLYGPGSHDKITSGTTSAVFFVWCFGDSDGLDKKIEKDLKSYLEVGGQNAFRLSGIDVIAPKVKSSFVVNPWEVKGDVDYGKLIKQFGTSPIDKKLLERIERATGELHPYLRRKIFFSHRDMDRILDAHEKGQPFALYTGRGPSGDTHLGHLIPWIFCKWLQDKFGSELYFMITDDEKFLVKDLSLAETKRLAYENILDIIAIGFDPEKTKIFLDTEYAKTLYSIGLEVGKKVTFSQAKAVFGFTNETNTGLIFYPNLQAAAAFLPSYLHKKQVPVLIPAAIDQDPYWRVARDVAPKLSYPKPAAIHSTFLPGLEEGGKMSSSNKNSAIYTTDSPKAVREKIMKYAFSGGQPTVEEHRRLGGNPDIDISYQYLTFFEEDDAKLAKIREGYRSGEILTGELKLLLVEKLTKFLSEHQRKRQEARKNIEKFLLRD